MSKFVTLIPDENSLRKFACNDSFRQLDDDERGLVWRVSGPLSRLERSYFVRCDVAANAIVVAVTGTPADVLPTDDFERLQPFSHAGERHDFNAWWQDESRTMSAGERAMLKNTGFNAFLRQIEQPAEVFLDVENDTMFVRFVFAAA